MSRGSTWRAVAFGHSRSSAGDLLRCTPTRTFVELTRCFTVDRTAADRDVTSLRAGQTVPVVAIGRMDLRKLLQPNGYYGAVPVELCVFGINPPNLPEPARRGHGVAALAAGRQPNPSARPNAAPPAAGAGQVWVNTNSGVYWMPGSRYYGQTKQGEYMTEQEAIRRGYRAAAGRGR